MKDADVVTAEDADAETDVDADVTAVAVETDYSVVETAVVSG